MRLNALSRLHPLTGATLTIVGYRKDGRPILPVLGASEPSNQPPANPPAPPAPPAPPVTPEKPEGVTEAEWQALGDPGKSALVRERQRATAAEQALAAARAPQTPASKPAPPKPADPPKGPDGQPDLAALIQQAVAAAVAPFQEREAQREAEAAAATVRDAVTTAASARFYDATDALAHINLTTLTDGTGRPDQQKITAALDDLLTRKPHLGKAVNPGRQAPPGVPIGASGGGTAAPLDDRVKATLARMQQAAGVKFADA